MPVLCNLVEHLGSMILTSLSLYGIYYWLRFKKAPAFQWADKLAMWPLVIYFLICFFFFLVNGIFRDHYSLKWDLDHEIRLLAVLPLFIIFTDVKIKPWVLWYGMALAAIVSGIYAVAYIYVFSAGERATGFYNPIAFGNLSLLSGFISLAGIRYFLTRHRLLVIIPLMGITCAMLAAFLSGTRGSILAIPVLALIYSFQISSFPRKNIIRACFFITILSLCSAYYHLPSSSLDHRMREGIKGVKAFVFQNVENPYAIRLSIWQEGMKIFYDHPLVGVGKDGYEMIIEEKTRQKKISPTIVQWETLHNMYLSNMVAYGVIGLIMTLSVFLCPLGALVVSLKKKVLPADMAYAGIMLVSGFMVFAFSSSIFYRNIYINYYVLFLSLIFAFRSSTKDHLMESGEETHAL